MNLLKINITKNTIANIGDNKITGFFLNDFFILLTISKNLNSFFNIQTTSVSFELN